MSVIKADACGSTNPNLSKSNCLIMPRETKRLLFSPNLNYELKLATLADEDLLKDEIAAGNLFLTPEFYDVRNSTINGAQIAQDNSGNSQVTRLTSNFNIEFGIKIGQCMLRKAQAWNSRQLQVWPVDENNGVEGYLTVNAASEEVLKGDISQLVFPPSMPRRINNSDIVYPSLTWLVDRDIINHVQAASFDFANVDGVVDLTFVVNSASTTSVVVTITEGCNGSPVLGLEDDLEVLNASLVAQTPTGVADNGDGSYTLAFTGLTPGTFSINLDATTVEVAGSSAIYGALETAKTFEVA